MPLLKNHYEKAPNSQEPQISDWRTQYIPFSACSLQTIWSWMFQTALDVMPLNDVATCQLLAFCFHFADSVLHKQKRPCGESIRLIWWFPGAAKSKTSGVSPFAFTLHFCTSESPLAEHLLFYLSRSIEYSFKVSIRLLHHHQVLKQ